MQGLVLPIVFLILFGLVGIANYQAKQSKAPEIVVNQASPSASPKNIFKDSSPVPTIKANSSAGIPVQITKTQKEIKIVAEEASLTAAANQTLSGVSLGETPLGEAKVSNVNIQLQNGSIKITGNASAGLISLPIEASAKVNLVDGKPKVVVDGVKAGSLPMPSSVNSQIEAPIQAQIDELLKDQDIEIKSITIENGSLTIIGVEK